MKTHADVIRDVAADLQRCLEAHPLLEPAIRGVLSNSTTVLGEIAAGLEPPAAPAADDATAIDPAVSATAAGE